MHLLCVRPSAWTFKHTFCLNPYPSKHSLHCVRKFKKVSIEIELLVNFAGKSNPDIIYSAQILVTLGLEIKLTGTDAQTSVHSGSLMFHFFCLLCDFFSRSRNSFC